MINFFFKSTNAKPLRALPTRLLFALAHFFTKKERGAASIGYGQKKARLSFETRIPYIIS